jgi:hypothetical protein
MADIIDMTERFPGKENLIEAAPLEFRRGEWRTGYAMLCTREESARFEAHRREVAEGHGHRYIAAVPNHFTLDDGSHYTAEGLFRHRRNEAAMRRVYRLAGLMECVTEAPSPILRTDLLRRFYQVILEEREDLKVVWRGHVRHFLLPIHPDRYNPALFLHAVANAESLKDLFAAIQSQTDAQFDILSRFYVFYLPAAFISRNAKPPEA